MIERLNSLSQVTTHYANPLGIRGGILLAVPIPWTWWNISIGHPRRQLKQSTRPSS